MEVDHAAPDRIERINALSQEQREILFIRLKSRIERKASATTRPSSKRLIAYIESSSSARLRSTDLHEFISDRLPDYMIPQRFVIVDSLPRLPSGKVDRRNLHMVAARNTEMGDHEIVLPRDPIEEILAKIWAEVLGLDSVGVNDDFFEMGGDSLLSIRILARANREGLKISPERFFAHPTIAEQAAAAGSVSGVEIDQGSVSGFAPLIPIQHWFFDRIVVDPQHWNQSYLFTISEPIDFDNITRALEKVLLHHDALRLQFVHADDGWRQQFSDSNSAVPLSRFDLSGLADFNRKSRISEIADELHRDIRIEQSPLLRVALIELDADSQDLLLIVAHHLVVDALSWTIILEDFEAACNQARARLPLELPDKTSSIKQWAMRLVDYANTDDAKRQFEYWVNVGKHDDHILPFDYPANPKRGDVENRMADALTLTTRLERAATETLLYELPRRFNAYVSEALLMALSRSICEWSGHSSFCLDLEGHGREAIFQDTDISRTVGWLTSVFPMRMVVDAADDLARNLAVAKEQIRGIPQNGIGYGLLRELCDDKQISAELRSRPHRQLCFNFLGQVDLPSDTGRLFRLRETECGVNRSAHGKRAYAIDVDAIIMGGRLQVNWTYNQKLHRTETIESVSLRFMQILSDLDKFCRMRQGGAYAPSDFPLADLDQAEFDGLSALLDDIDNIEDSD